MTAEAKGTQEKRKRSWFVRALVGGTVLGAFLVLVLGLGLVGLYVKRVEAVNALLEKAALPFEVRVEAIEHEGLRRFEVSGVELRRVGEGIDVRVEGVEFEGMESLVVRGIALRTAGREESTAAVERIEIDYTVGDLLDVASWTVESVIVSKPVVVVDDVAKGAIEELLAEDGEPEAEGAGEGGGIADLVLGTMRIEEGRVDVTWGVMPRVVFGFEVQGDEVRLMGAGPISEGALQVSLREFEVGDGMVRAPALDLAVHLEEGFGGGRVEPFELGGLEVMVGPKAFALFGADDEGSEAAAEDLPETKEGGAWSLEGVTIAGGKFSLLGFDGSEEDLPVLPDVRFEVGGEVADLRLEGGKIASRSSQRLEISNLEIVGGAPGEQEAVAGRIESIVVEMVPDAFFADGVIEKVQIDAPKFDVTPASVARLVDGGDEGKGALPAEERKPIVVRDLAVKGGEFTVDPQLVGQAIPVTGGTFEVTMREGEASDDDAFYRATVGGVRLKTPGEDGENFLQLQAMVVDFSALGLQGRKRLDGIRLRGIRVAIDSALQDLFASEEGDAAATSESAAATVGAGESSFAGWTLGSLGVGDTRITISDLLPDIPAISFEIEINENELTLGDDRNQTGETMRKVEIPRVEIPSPRNTFVKVADLRNIFVEFTLKGLVNQEIESIHAADSRIFVGEHLFWYVDYTRKFNEERIAAAEKEAAGKVMMTEDRTWKVKKFVAENGKMFIAPKGYPVPGIPPFPFSVDSDLETGEIDLTMKIENKTYILGGLGVELTLRGLKGEATFNVPFKQESNNLWQYFYVDQVRFRDYEATNVELAMTYYEGGVSATFGGEAYEGYVNGGVNVYIGEKYAWDAWLSGSEVDLAPITEAAIPETFFLDTTVSAQVVAAGVELDLGLADAYLSELAPGRFEITKLNEILNDLRDEWSDLKKQAIKIGVEQLRDFEFDEGSGGVGYFDSMVELKNADLNVSPYFEAIEFPEKEPAGFLTLELKGEEGLRSFELDYYDRTAAGKAKRAKRDALSASNP